MTVKTVLNNDNSTIIGIYGPEDHWSIEVGRANIDKIEAYLEDGNIPWFAVSRGGKIASRVNSIYVGTVVYTEKERAG